MYLISFLISCVFNLESSAYFLIEYDRYIKKIDEFLKLLIILMLLTERLFIKEIELIALKYNNNRYINYNFMIKSEHIMIVSEYNKTEFMTE